MRSLMTLHAVRRAFARRIRTLAAELPGALEDDVEAVHRSRVASRRLREILPVLDVAEELGGGAAPIRSRVRRLTRALGGVRELDVTLGILDELGGRYPELAPVLEGVRSGVAEERQLLREGMAAQFDQMDAMALAEQLAALVSGISAESRAGRTAVLTHRLARRADRLEAAVDEAGSLYVPERLHAVRIAAKQLRYALELVHEFGGVGTRRLTTQVKRFQDLLGRLHDLEVVSGRVRRHGWTGDQEYSEQARQLQQAIDREIRELHAEYLANAVALKKVVVTCRATIQPRLAAARRQGRAGGTR
jgi:CHAD domain-containing protein